MTALLICKSSVVFVIKAKKGERNNESDGEGAAAFIYDRSFCSVLDKADGNRVERHTDTQLPPRETNFACSSLNAMRRP